MKKISKKDNILVNVYVLVSAFIILLGLVGCGKKMEEAVSFEYVGYKDGILQIRMTNGMKENILYGYPYSLYKKQGDEWEYLTEERSFLAIAMELAAGESLLLEMEFKGQDSLSDGIYKFEKDYETADEKMHTGEVQFEISQEGKHI